VVEDDGRLTLEDLVAHERILVALLFVGVGVWLLSDVINELLDALVVEKASHRVGRVDESSLNVFLVEDVLESQVFSVEQVVEVLRVVEAAIQRQAT
jgi:hypothetical protein